ncbi:RsmB/NOP family class I SAM-dependent RNA methyltransferase [Dyadobacter helix]|uniref:RsmB/NOP family class I SAM-dependent RNA methyltransferase n=1 Tax=Dyadobacter helix TaxID=2822344 RepID=UPI001BFCAF49|nr:RsmB/NOP family class I SAM-dependent RNA methyltransferase [Dyadobacter sp. CECT 9275]
MKLHKVLVEAVLTGLQEIFVLNKQADKVVEQLLKSNKKWGARDRAFLAENIYEMCRWWRLINFSAGISEPLDSTDYWTLFATWLTIKPLHFSLENNQDLPQWAEFEGMDLEDILKRYREGLETRSIAESIPDWLDETGASELGDNWDTELMALNKQAPVVLRVNTLKTDIATVSSIFGPDETGLIPGVPHAVVLKKRQNVFSRDSFKMGYFEVQDAGSQLIAPYLDVHPGQTVIDACAGAGGKTLHIASLLENRGKIVAMDLDLRKLHELERRAKRNGVTCIKTDVIHSEKDIRALKETADRLLLDVPCSGLGVLRRNPDSKWKLKPSFLDAIRKTQWQILTGYSAMVKPGGKMVYATCSILPSESEEQVKRFVLERGHQWRLVSEQRTSVARDGFDGFYMALLEKQ